VFEFLKDPSWLIIGGNCQQKVNSKAYFQNEEEERYENKRDAMSFLYSPAQQIERGSDALSPQPWPIVTIISTEQGDGASQIESGDRENQPLLG
jgi:hypothetical protein